MNQRSSIAFLLVFVSVLFGHVRLLAEENNAKPTKYVILSSPKDAQLGASLFRVLRGKANAIRFEKVDNLEDAVKSDADVIVAVGTNRVGWATTPEILDSLKKRKVIGIGYGASSLFAALGLEINGGKCMHFRPVPPKNDLPQIKVGNSNLLDAPDDSPIKILESDTVEEGKMPDVFAMHLPKHSEDAKYVEAVVRFTEHANYAPIVRQGNYMLIGIPIDARKWTRPYEELVRQACINFHDREPVKFQTAERSLTEPGTYDLDFAERGNTEKAYGKTLYFRFGKPTTLKLRLEHPGNVPIMMMFRGGNGRHTKRIDARNADPLEITVSIVEKDIQSTGQKLWELGLTNFGKLPAKCKLTVSEIDSEK